MKQSRKEVSKGNSGIELVATAGGLEQAAVMAPPTPGSQTPSRCQGWWGSFVGPTHWNLLSALGALGSPRSCFLGPVGPVGERRSAAQVRKSVTDQRCLPKSSHTDWCSCSSHDRHSERHANSENIVSHNPQKASFYCPISF